MVNRQRLVDTFVRLIKTDSPTFNEHVIAGLIKTELRACGCDVHIQDYGKSINVIAYKEGVLANAPAIILNAHTDTVESTEGLEFAVEEDRIRSTGHTVLGSDDKGGIAQIIEALRVIEESRVEHGPIEIVFTSAEEKGLVGAKNLDVSLLRGRYALVLDSSGPVGNLIIGAPTHITYKMTVTGRSAHAGIEPEKGISAIKAASDIIMSIPDGRLDELTTANVGVISGGSATNIVPKEVLIKGEIRSHKRDTLHEKRDSIFSSARTAAERHSAGLSIEEAIEYESFSIGRDEPFLRLIEQAYLSCGIEPRLALTGGGSDANIFNQCGIKAINLSNGMQAVHSNDEFIMIDDLIKGAEVVVSIVSMMRGMK